MNETIPHSGGEEFKIKRKIHIEDLLEILKSHFEMIRKKNVLKETRNNHLLDEMLTFMECCSYICNKLHKQMTVRRKVTMKEKDSLQLGRLTEEFGEEYPVRGNYNPPGGSNQVFQVHWGLERPKPNNQ